MGGHPAKRRLKRRDSLAGPAERRAFREWNVASCEVQPFALRRQDFIVGRAQSVLLD